MDLTIRATGELTESSAAALDQLLSLVSTDRETAWTIDLSGIVAIDSEGARVLSNFLREVPRARMTRPSRAVREFFAKLGAETPDWEE
jgi:anti-anti-sigma regulatory factor